MKKSMLALLLTTALMLATPVLAHEGEDHGTGAMHEHSHDAKPAKAMAAEISATSPLKAGESYNFTIKLTSDGAPVSEAQLQEVHTRKVHLLVVDESLTDYNHLHPQALDEAGTYSASFTPMKSATYKVFADVTPVGASQQFVVAKITGEKPCDTPCIDKTASTTGAADGLKADLFFKSALKVGAPVMAMARITDDSGKPVTDLEPVMGAFAHIVGFYDDFATVAHIHPMGKEPTADTERSGPDLSFHLEPAKAGSLKLFVQVRRGGKDIFIPVGIEVK